MTMLKEIRGYLEAQGVAGGDTGWVLRAGRMPSSPNQVVGLFLGPGEAPETKSTLRRPGLQVRVRGEKDAYEDTLRKANQIFHTLHARTQLLLGRGYYAYIIARSDIMPLGYDDNGRPEFSINFSTARKEQEHEEVQDGE